MGSLTSRPESHRVCFAILEGLWFYLLAAVLVLVPVLVATLLIPESSRPGAFRTSATCGDAVIFAMTRWDGQWFESIVMEGYHWKPTEQSNVAFFPLYPLSATAIHRLTFLDERISLLVASQLFLLATLVVARFYVVQRFPLEGALLARYVLFAIVFFPTGFFARMAYSESLFLFLSVVALLGLERRWPAVVTAFVIGLATAARPVGVALLTPFLCYLIQNELYLTHNGAQMIRLLTVSKCLALLLCACWGLLAFALFLGIQCGEPLAFAKAQDSWRWRPKTSNQEKMVALVTLKPVWTVYESESPVYWKVWSREATWAWSLQFANPILFCGAAALAVIGWRLNWLTNYELYFLAGLIFIPYLTRSFEMGMAGHGRYVAGMFPIYIVLGKVLSNMKPIWKVLAIGGMAYLLAVYTMYFASGYMLI